MGSDGRVAWALPQFGQADGARVNVDVSFATTSSFVAGTRLGAMSTNDTFVLVTPSTFDDPATFIDPSHRSIYVRVSPSYQQDQEGVFAESDPWVTTSECADTVHYLNDTDAVGDLEPAVGKWACLDCPFNAVCEGGQFNTWHRVRAKFGSWRANQANRGASEFLPCLAPQMCLGAPNPNLMGLHFDQSNPDIDLALVENVTAHSRLQIVHSRSYGMAPCRRGQHQGKRMTYPETPASRLATCACAQARP